ncbi:hypothetical protein [uncultured Winogradskyella sp.]|uniref:hypothetical protein n=1 Tax=uncultured Winogradskyella sp. TaxID=395353 RepID=UPI00262C5BB7|nr:hypothetical protein [uncultured Winogradskyella sp.]
MKTEDLTYIDWNLFSILKEPKLNPHIVLDDFLKRQSDKITLVYSDAHLGDLARTSDELSSTRINDLNYLSAKTKDLVIVKYFGRDYVDVENRNALEFYEQNVYDNSTAPLVQWQTIVKQMTDNYGHLRDDIIKTHFKLDPKSICNFSVSQLDELIKMIGISGSLKEFVEFGLSLRGYTSTNPLTYIDYYTTAYMNLDLIGFFPDSMNEKGDFSNLLNDSKHSAYGSICKAFITNDNKCYHKSKFLFEYFKSNSKLIKTCKLKNGTSELENELNNLTE